MFLIFISSLYEVPFGKNMVLVGEKERKGEERKREKEGEKKGKKAWKTKKREKKDRE